MENLQNLRTVRNFKLNQEVVKRIRNIKKLFIWNTRFDKYDDHYGISNLECLDKLESLRLVTSLTVASKLAFPQSLKKLSLSFAWNVELKEVMKNIGELPLLQVLKLRGGAFRRGEWRTVEGHFPKLEILTLLHCDRLERWTSESFHFPLLKEIDLDSLVELKEIPSEIGDLPNLRKIRLGYCNMSAVMCLKEIVEEQEESQGEEQLPFHVRVIVHKEEEREALERLAGPNFEVLFV